MGNDVIFYGWHRGGVIQNNTRPAVCDYCVVDNVNRHDDTSYSRLPVFVDNIFGDSSGGGSGFNTCPNVVVYDVVQDLNA